MGKKRTGRPNGRRTALAELIDAQFLQDILDGKVKVQDVQPQEFVITRKRIVEGKVDTYKEIATGFKNGQHALAWHLLTGNEKLLSKTLDKLIASKTDVSSGNKPLQAGGFIIIPEKETE